MSTRPSKSLDLAECEPAILPIVQASASFLDMMSYNQTMRHPGLLNDIMFKIVFGHSQSTPILRALINALLDLRADDRIVDLVILNPASEKTYLSEKGSILDVKARDNAGRQYNIEVQLRAGSVDYIKRSLYYMTKFYCDQLEKGQAYDLLARTVSISLLDFNIFPDSANLHSKFGLWEKEQDFLLSSDLEIHYIELRKFTPNKPEQLRTRFEKWLYVLKFADLYGAAENKLPDILANEEGITLAIDSMRKAYARDEIREVIEAREKAERDEVSRLYRATEEGREEGREEGLEKGIEKGELKKNHENAQRMLSLGLDHETIRQVTGLDAAQLDPPEDEIR